MITMTELSVNRDKGMVPGQALLIPMVPTPKCSMIQIKIDSTDLRALWGLDIVIAYDEGIRDERVIALADAVVRAQPDDLTFWNIKTGRFLSVVVRGKISISEIPPRYDRWDYLPWDEGRPWDDLS